MNHRCISFGSMLCVLCLSATTHHSRTKAQNDRETLLSPDNAYNPMPSPDGRYIAYVRTGWGERIWSGFGRASLVSDVKVLNTEGGLRPRTLAPDFFLSGWTPDSTQVICFRDGRYELVSPDGKSESRGRIPNVQNLEPFSEWVAYLPNLGSVIWSRPIDKLHRTIETPHETIVREETSLGERALPSPDGRYIAIIGGTSKAKLRVYDLNSETWTDFGTVTIHPDEKWLYTQPNWSPWFADSSRLVFLKESMLVVSSLDGEQKTEIKTEGSAGLPVPSPDGRSVAYVTYEPRPMRGRPDLQFWGGTTINVISLDETGKPRAVTEVNPDEVLDLKWLDNNTLVFDRVADEVFYKHARIWKVRVRK